MSRVGIALEAKGTLAMAQELEGQELFWRATLYPEPYTLNPKPETLNPYFFGLERAGWC